MSRGGAMLAIEVMQLRRAHL